MTKREERVRQNQLITRWRHERAIQLVEFRGLAVKIECCPDCFAKIEKAMDEAMRRAGYIERGTNKSNARLTLEQQTATAL